LNHATLKELQTESKNLKNMITYSFVSSAIALAVYTKIVKFGSGFTPKLIKLGLGISILAGPTIYVGNTMKIKLA
jgi:hypothetical protein